MENTGIATQDQTAQTEEQDRINRFNRLAALNGVVRPDIHETMLPPGSVDFMTGPVPVVRVVFPERAFFAFDSATPLPGSGRILDVIAENMKHDVPDAALTILGHTDAIGTDPYNLDLSRRRAQAVMQALVERGVSPEQLTEVAIGKRQPIAPNDTSEGRSLNRRVEFLVSPAMSANLAAVQQYVVPVSYFSTGTPDRVQQRKIADDGTQLASIANVYKLHPAAQGATAADVRQDTLAPIGGLPLSPASTQSVERAKPTAVAARMNTAAPVQLAMTMPVTPVHLIPPSEVLPRQLGTAVTY